MERRPPVPAWRRYPSLLRHVPGPAVGLALALLLLAPGVAAADTGTPSSAATPATGALAVAQARLQTLEGQIRLQVAARSGLETQLLAYSARLTVAEDHLTRLRMRAGWVGREIAAGLTGRPDRLRSFLSLRERVRSRVALARSRVNVLLTDMRNHPILPDLVKAQAIVRNLNRERRRALAIVSTLQAGQWEIALSSLAGDVQGLNAITYGDWARLFLRTLGAPECGDNLTTVVAWQAAEFTQAGWNPLATTLAMQGATAFNGAGVRNYVSLQQGLQASALTLRGGSRSYGYDWILYRLGQCASPEITAAAINASAWCSGCANGTYVTGLIPQVEASYDLYARL